MSIWGILRRTTQTLYISGVRLRCPHCHKGRIFATPFEVAPTCSHCQVRFERMSGESLGGLMFSMTLLPIVSIAGFFVGELVYKVPRSLNIGFWLGFILLSVGLMYRHARAIWIGISYLSGGVYADAPTAPTNALRERVKEAFHTAHPKPEE